MLNVWQKSSRLATLGLVLLQAAAAGLAATQPAGAQCNARVQTGVGSSAVALAQRCGTTVGDLRRANPGRNLDQPGLITIPGGRNDVTPDGLNNDTAPAPGINATRQRPVAPGTPTYRQPGEPPMRGGNGSADRTMYEVRPGDTLSAIASRRGVSVSALMRANPGIVPERLSIGQTITLPES